MTLLNILFYKLIFADWYSYCLYIDGDGREIYSSLDTSKQDTRTYEVINRRV